MRGGERNKELTWPGSRESVLTDCNVWEERRKSLWGQQKCMGATENEICGDGSGGLFMHVSSLWANYSALKAAEDFKARARRPSYIGASAGSPCGRSNLVWFPLHDPSSPETIVH